MSQISLQPPEKVDFSNSQTVSRDWKRFVQQWRNYELATGLQTKTMDFVDDAATRVVKEDAQLELVDLTEQEKEDHMSGIVFM